MKNFDVVIIGAGLAGLQCAKLLSREKVRVLLVDRKEDLAKGVHTTGIFVRKTFDDFHFPQGTLGKPISNVTLYSPGLKPLVMKSEKEEFRVGKMGLLYKTILSECMENGVEFMAGTRYVSAVSRRKSRTDGSFEEPEAISDARQTSEVLYAAADDCPRGQATIVSLEKSGTPIQIETRVLIGADGAISRVARDLGLDLNKDLIVGYEEVYRGVPLRGASRLDCFLDARLAPGYLAWITNDGEESHIGVGGYPASFNPRHALRIFRKKIAPNFIDLKDADFCERRGGRIPVGGVLKRIANTNGLLVGDAAGAVSPLTAGGLDPCLRLSQFASSVVLESLKTDDPGVLLKYSGSMFRAKFTTRLLMRRALRVMRYQPMLELGFKILEGRIGRRIAEKIFFRRGSFPDVDVSRYSLNIAES